MATNYANMLGTPSVVGVGSNAVPNQEQDKIYEQFKGATLGAVGSGLSKLGASSVGNQLQRWGGMLNPKPVYASDGSNIDQIVSAMVSRGYDPATARAVASKEPDRFAREYLTTGDSTPASPTSYNIGGQDVTASSPTKAVKSIYPESDYEKYSTQYDNDPTRFINDINSMYSGGDAFLTERESALRTALNEFNKLIEGDYALNLQKGTQAKESSKSTLASNKIKAQETKQSALNAARQLYTQLEQSARQRFGGSGAGKAALAILGQEQQRQGGQIQRDYQSTAANIDQKMYEVDTQYNTLVQELDLAKQKAIYDSNQSFQNQLTTISENRMLNEQAKQKAIMEIMLKFRDDQNAIVAANEEYKRNLDLMKQQAMLQAGNYQSGFNTASNQFATSGGQLVGDYTNKYSNISSNLTPSNNQTSIQTSSSPYQSMTGYMPWMGYEDKDKQQSIMY